MNINIINNNSYISSVFSMTSINISLYIYKFSLPENRYFYPFMTWLELAIYFYIFKLNNNISELD